MICHQNILPLILSLFILIATISLYQLPASYVFAESPPLVRQEIQDGLDDVIAIDDCKSTITKLTKSNNTQLNEIFDSIDIERVSYFSDGKILNATMWLSPPGLDYNFLPPENVPINFGILIDVNPNPAIGVGGVDYHKEAANYQISDLPANNGEATNSWIEDTHETISYGLHRYLKVSEQNYNYTNVFQQQTEKAGFVYYIPLSLDLSTIALPDKYKIMFYTFTSSNSGCDRITDFTGWIDIPPPKFVISSSPIVLELRPGDAKDLGIVLKSTTGIVHKIADFTNLENNSGIKVIPTGGKLNGSVFSVEPVSFNVQVPKNAQTGEYAIPMLVNISTGSAIPSEFVGVNKYNSSIPTESFITTVANLTIKVLEPLTPSERFREVWDTYGGFISLVGGGFAAGVTSLVFDRLKDRKKKN